LETKKEKTARVKKETKQKLKSSGCPPEQSDGQPSNYKDNLGSSKVLFQLNNCKTIPPKSLPCSDKKSFLLVKGQKSLEQTPVYPTNSSLSIGGRKAPQNDAEANWAAKMSPKRIKVIEAAPVNEKNESNITEHVKVTETPQQPQPDRLKAKPLFLPSVSKILNVTMPQEQAEALEKWQAKMIAQLGVEGFRMYKESKEMILSLLKI